MLRVFTLILFLCCFSAISALADNIGWITLHNEADAITATAIFGSAFERDNNRFLVRLSPSQNSRLKSSGLSFELLLSGYDISELWLIQRSEQPSDLSIVQSIPGRHIDLGNGTYLSHPTTGFASEEVRDFHGRPLSDLSIRFLYIPNSISVDLSQVIDYPTDSLISRISLDSLYAMDTRLEAFRTRYLWSDSIDMARDWIVQKCLDWGYTDVQLQPFDWGGGTHYNIVITKLGYAEPDVVIVVGGHYDSWNQGSDPLVFAPGTDDNGSGTTVTLELARVLADVPLRKTIVFMPFSAEEQGLVGSSFAAEDFVAKGTNVEVMYNFDMVAFDPDSAFEISVSAQAPVLAYSEFTASTAERVTSLTPVLSSTPGASDHASFAAQGFPIVNSIEANFNYAGWHTNLDISTRLNFEYLTEVAKMAVASVSAVAESAHPTSIDHITDIGDGQSLEVFWTDCDPTYTYTVYWGEVSGSYTDSMNVPSGNCSAIVSGLREGVTQYFSVIGRTSSGLSAMYAHEGSLKPLVVPRTPSSLSVVPEHNQIVVSWSKSIEADFNHYRIYRKMGQLPYVLYTTVQGDTAFIDTDVLGQVEYSYQISVVDNDGNMSELSPEQSSYSATFDGGILVVDDITKGFVGPTQAEQEAFFDTVMGNSPYSLIRIEQEGTPLTKSDAGRFSTIFWFDDDLATKIIAESEETISWFTDYPGNCVIGGLRTVYFWGSTILPGDVRYDAFGCGSIQENQARDFSGAIGQNGWPSLVVDPQNPFNGNIPNIGKMTAVDSAIVIYTYDAFSDDPLFEGEPVGLLNRTNNGYRILLSFPLSYMTEESVIDMISYAQSLFGETDVIAVAGDADGSGTINVSDIIAIVNYLFGEGSLIDLNRADVDGSCEINTIDIVYLINYLFFSGSVPVDGCVTR